MSGVAQIVQLVAVYLRRFLRLITRWSSISAVSPCALLSVPELNNPGVNQYMLFRIDLLDIYHPLSPVSHVRHLHIAHIESSRRIGPLHWAGTSRPPRCWKKGERHTRCIVWLTVTPQPHKKRRPQTSPGKRRDSPRAPGSGE